MENFFDSLIPRTKTHCFKWDGHKKYSIPEDAIPLWVSDMDFASPSCITNAFKNRVTHPIYGYTMVSDEYNNALISWLEKRHDWRIKLEWLVITQNIMTAIKTCLHCFCNSGDGVLIQEPVYDNFKKSILQCDLIPVIHPLIQKETHYTIDWDLFEKQLSYPHIKIFILCNPHNPVGKVWTKDELQQIAHLCIKHNVLIVSDEIHQDIVFPPAKHIPIANLSPEIGNQVITCTSPAKIFNTPSLSFGNIIIPNPILRKQFETTLNASWSGNMSPFGQLIVEEGYTHGANWVNKLISYLQINHQYVIAFCHKYMPKLKITPAEATFLMWIDCRQLGLPEDILLQDLQQKAKLWVHPGSLYGESGEGFIRINIAIPKILLDEVLNRLKHYYDSLG